MKRQYSLLRRVKAREARPWLAFDLAPLLGVMMAILYLLMSPHIMWSDLPGHGADIPHSVYAQPLPGGAREDAIIIEVDRDARFFLDGKEIRPDDIPAMVRRDIGKGAEHKVYIRADAKAKYADVEEVVEEVKATGVKDVDFLTWAEPEKSLR